MRMASPTAVLRLSSTFRRAKSMARPPTMRSEEHTSELQSQSNLVCRLLLEKKEEHQRPKRGAHHYRRRVRARRRRNLAHAEYLVRMPSELQVGRVARLLRVLAVRGDLRLLD